MGPTRELRAREWLTGRKWGAHRRQGLRISANDSKRLLNRRLIEVTLMIRRQTTFDPKQSLRSSIRYLHSPKRLQFPTPPVANPSIFGRHVSVVWCARDRESGIRLGASGEHAVAPRSSCRGSRASMTGSVCRSFLSITRRLTTAFAF